MARNDLVLFSDLDRLFGRSLFGPAFRWPALRPGLAEMANWVPEIDVFERDGALITRIDLPGMKKEDVKVAVSDGHLVISGERKSESEEKKENVYRAERSHGTFSRAVSLPSGVKVDDVKATFANGVLEVMVPLEAKGAVAQTVEVHDAPAP